MAKKIKNEVETAMKRKYNVWGRLIICAGIIGIIFTIISIIFGKSGSPARALGKVTFRVGMALLILGCACLYLNSLKIKKLMSIYNFVDCGEESINNIVTAMEIPYVKATEYIEKLIKEGFIKDVFIKDVFINVSTGQIERRKDKNSKPVNNVICPNCNASTSDKNGVCEYCGASLK